MSEPEAPHESITVEPDAPPIVADPVVDRPDEHEAAPPHPVDEPLPPVEQMPDAQTAVPDPLPEADGPASDPISALPTGAYVVEG